MNEIETTLESVPAPRSTTRRSAPRTRFEQSKNGDAMPLLLTVDDAATCCEPRDVQSTPCSNEGNCLE
jgi:hypothetical protein